MTIIDFILKTFDHSKREEIVRCLNKASIIIYYDDFCLVADDTYVYFGALGKNKRKRYSMYKHLLKGKKFFTEKPEAFKNHSKQQGNHYVYD